MQLEIILDPLWFQTTHKIQKISNDFMQRFWPPFVQKAKQAHFVPWVSETHNCTQTEFANRFDLLPLQRQFPENRRLSGREICVSEPFSSDQ